MKPLTIIIPNYNGAHLLKRNLPSVLRAVEQYGPARVLVVDDGSTDSSRDVLREQFPEVTTIAHDLNRGFSEAIATGVHHAETDLLFLLNSDVELHPGCLEKLEPYFESVEEVFSVCPLMLDEDGTINRHSWNLRSFNRGYLKLVDWDNDTARSLRRNAYLPCLYSSGGSMMVSKAKFIALGGFHPIFKPFYGEDFDLGLRAWYRGWPSYFEPEATLTHQSQGSIKNAFKRARVKQIRCRNRYFIEWIHTPIGRLLGSTLPFTLFQLCGELLLLNRVNLKGFATALAALPEALEARRSRSEHQVLTLDQIINTILNASRVVSSE